MRHHLVDCLPLYVERLIAENAETLVVHFALLDVVFATVHFSCQLIN